MNSAHRFRFAESMLLGAIRRKEPFDTLKIWATYLINAAIVIGAEERALIKKGVYETQS